MLLSEFLLKLFNRRRFASLHAGGASLDSFQSFVFIDLVEKDLV
jgi:hypothetical protein